MDRSSVFISWSGERSRQIALKLGTWLEDVLQTVEPFMSDTDIAAGDIWFDQIGANLEGSRFAIICITPENLDSRWLHFEAGAIGMTSDEQGRSAVVPYLVGLNTTDLAPPLSLFQAVAADKDGTLRLLRSLNNRLPVKVDAGRLERTFERWWPDLETSLQAIPSPMEAAAVAKGRTERELLEEALSLLRARPREPQRGLTVNARGIAMLQQRISRLLEMDPRDISISEPRPDEYSVHLFAPTPDMNLALIGDVFTEFLGTTPVIGISITPRPS
jgi:hypothetical protein